MMWGWDGVLGFGGLVMMFMMFLFWGLVIAGIVYLVKMLSTGSTIPPRDAAGPGPTSASKALEILEERYARGEIETEEYEEKKRNLTS